MDDFDKSEIKYDIWNNGPKAQKCLFFILFKTYIILFLRWGPVNVKKNWGSKSQETTIIENRWVKYYKQSSQLQKFNLFQDHNCGSGNKVI